MQINNLYSNQKIYILPTSCNISFHAGHAGYSNTRSISNIMAKISHYTIDEYKSLSEEELNLIRYVCQKELKPQIFEEKIHDLVSENIKNYLNNLYGQGKYIVLIVGRSLSSIGKVLGYKISEENVKNIPLSNAGKYLYQDNIEKEKKCGGIEVLKAFLKSIGLSKEKINDSDKKIVILDFCVTGSSLKGAKKLLTRDDILGQKNISALNVEDCIQDEQDKSVLEKRLFFSKYKDISFVERADTLSDIPNAIVNTKKDKMEFRLFRFRLLDNFMKYKKNK